MHIRKRLLKAVELIRGTETTDPDFFDAWVDEDWCDVTTDWLTERQNVLTRSRDETGVESEDADEE